MQDFEDSRNYLQHKRAIIYINTDLLSLLPEVGVNAAALRWEDKVLACNEAARGFGIADNLPFNRAVQLCPSLIVLGAEHIPPLADIVNQVNKLFRTYSCSLERVNVNECYLDVTSHPLLVNARNNASRVGSDGCPCGCQGLLSAARQLGEQLQTTLLMGLRVRSRAGVSCSKLLARLAVISSYTNQCSLVSPEDARQLLIEEDVANVLPGKLATSLKLRGIHTTADIRKLSLDDLQSEVGLDDAVAAINAACGVDVHPVITCDLWRSFCVEYEIREKFCVLLLRIFSLAEEDVRTPIALKVSVRKWDAVRKTCSKEAKVAPISCGVNVCGRPSPDVMTKLMNVIMTCFRRLVDMTRPFQLSLLGLAFVRFHDQTARLAHPSMRSVASCLLRKRELSVEVPVNLVFEGDGTFVQRAPSEIEQLDCSDVEEHPQNEKKAKLDIFIKSKRFLDDSMDVCSPSKLRVGDLSLGEDKSTSRGILHW